MYFFLLTGHHHERRTVIKKVYVYGCYGGSKETNGLCKKFAPNAKGDVWMKDTHNDRLQNAADERVGAKQ